MTGNVALDVVIGLTFVYLLYSLYCTVIMEMISSLFGLRGRNLNYALKRMLMDEKVRDFEISNKFHRLLTTILQITGHATNLKNDMLYKRFFDQASIKYLSSGGVGRRPSYLATESFVKGLIDAIGIKDQDVSMLARIEEGIERLALEFNPPTAEDMRIAEVQAKATDSPWLDEYALRIELMRQRALDKSDTIRHLQSLLLDANGDLAKFKMLLENWFNDTMDRSSGWFKRSTQTILLTLGFIITLIFNVDTIAIVKKLSNNPVAREQMVRMAIAFSENNSGILDTIKCDSNEQDSSSVHCKKLKMLAKIETDLQRQIKESQAVLSSEWAIPKERVGTISRAMYVIDCVFSGNNLWGYLLTAIALSLGAPFWFDLLNKLIKLRTSSQITTPNASTPTPALAASNDSKKDTLNRAG